MVVLIADGTEVQRADPRNRLAEIEVELLCRQLEMMGHLPTSPRNPLEEMPQRLCKLRSAADSGFIPVSAADLCR
jgi:hypothetical protein